MSDLDPSAIDGAALHIGGAATASAIGAAIMNWLRGRDARAASQRAADESQRVATELALLRNDLTAVLKSLEKHEGLGERVALLERDMKACHERLDGKRGKR